MKRDIEHVLIYLHNNLDSKIIQFEEEWVLETQEKEVIREICKMMYGLSRDERKMLQGRILTENAEIIRIFKVFKTESTIKFQLEASLKNPCELYYTVHNLPIPDYFYWKD